MLCCSSEARPKSSRTLLKDIAWLHRCVTNQHNEPLLRVCPCWRGRLKGCLTVVRPLYIPRGPIDGRFDLRHHEHSIAHTNNAITVILQNWYWYEKPPLIWYILIFLCVWNASQNLMTTRFSFEHHQPVHCLISVAFCIQSLTTL